MPEHRQDPADELQRLLDGEPLRDWLQQQRWYASKSRHVTGIEIWSRACRCDEDPALVLALVQARFATGTHELYQLPLGSAARRRRRRRPTARPRSRDADGWAVFDARQDPRLARAAAADRLERRPRDRRGTVPLPPRRRTPRPLDEHAAVRPMGVEQSNTSLVFDDRLVLKVFRKLEPGINPELEMLRFLTAHGFPNIAPLHGWYEYDGQSLRRHARRRPAVPPRRRSTAGSWRSRRSPPIPSGSSSGSAASARSPRSCTPCWPPTPAIRPSRRRSRATRRSRCSPRRSTRTSSGSSCACPTTTGVAPIAGRGQEVRERLAARAQLGDRRPRDPHPRRLPPRPDPADARAAG